jgi:hypothetical protein
MSISITHFETLRQQYPSWAELRAHLESAAGGNLRVVEQGEGNPLAVIRYVKGRSTLGAAELGAGLFRSVVWDTVANRPVCVAPPKAREGLPPLGVELAATQDFVDGFMVNAFVRAAGDLELATRTQLGGGNRFYSEKTFGQLFDEALATTPLKGRAGVEAALREVGGGTAFASFVVQHPEHRIVAKVATPTVYVVQVGTVLESGKVELQEQPGAWPQSFARLQPPSWAARLFRSEQEIQDLLRKTAVQRGWRWQGFVFKDGAGGRWRIRTPTYTMLRELRGSESTAVERFLRLRATGKVGEYIRHYSEEKVAFWDMEQKLRARTNDVLSAYCDVHKAHAVKFKELPDAYRTPVYHLHLEWLNVLRMKGYKVRIQNAIAIVNRLRDFEQARLLEAEPYVAVGPVAAATEAPATEAPAPSVE